MDKWLDMRFFLICTCLMGILLGNRYLNGEIDLGRMVMSTVFGGLFWGVVVTAIVKKFRK
jgi:hypothetical protein